ncbi:hypothetical protein K1T35_19110 [Pseudonocardia sp. DSM 110487]|uniref:hypothetical protein n=1 Tax=Pseudonocardia sp. DSM 110487 TaxID=2865833 RepID=UPI001C6A1789|nr:hypothetical protein [Pseudonocardia sp. DSM 110487]QYN39116.1 hypothetical protein K1T35_19110 [Pseudonocardia sp. DSM 110487]
MSSSAGTAVADAPEAPAAADPAVPRRRYAGLAVLVGCTGVATASLALPALLGFDPWVWLIWGREALRGGIATDGSVAWKPLPVLVTAPAAVFGEAAPALWTVAVRACGLFGLVLVVRLAVRIAKPHCGAMAGSVAGVVAAAAFLLSPDGESRWLRHMLQGNIEPVTVMLCLWAAERHLDGRRRHALLLLCAAALTRPEAWPFLGGYAGWLLWCERRRWWWAAPTVLAVLAAVPVLWFAGDRLVSGNALSGATVAQVLMGTTPTQRWILAIDNVAACVIAPVWVAAAVCVVWAAHRRRGLPAALAACALVWAAEVAVMAGVFGYAALGRFLAPVSALLCVLAGAAAGWAVTAPRPVLLRAAVAVAIVAVAVPFAAPRVAWLPLQLQHAEERSAYEHDLYAVAAALGGRDGLVACGNLAIDAVRPAVELRPALAYRLDVPLAGVNHTPGPGTTIAQVGSPLHALLLQRPAGEVTLVARSARWAVYTESCGRPG